MIENVVKVLPIELASVINELTEKENITEIRLRVGNTAKVYFGKTEKELVIKVTKNHLLQILSNVSSNSIYSVQNDINKGFITIEGGNRIGIAGEVVIVDGKIRNVKEISSMNIRIANQHIGCSNQIMDEIVKDGVIKNTIILSPPGLGKTTLLRDVIRNLSRYGYNVTLIDERGEIAAMYNGVPTLEVGERTDVISFVDKAFGMQMAVRSLAPNVICTDEIGNIDDVLAVKHICKCGVSFITTMHGKTLEDITRGYMKELVDEGYINTVIVLSSKIGIGKIDKVYTNLKDMEEIKC